MSPGSKWSQVSDFLRDGVNNQAFSSSTAGYVISNNSTPLDLEFWKFNPSNGTGRSWIQLALLAEVIGVPSSAATIGNMGLVYLFCHHYYITPIDTMISMCLCVYVFMKKDTAYLIIPLTDIINQTGDMYTEYCFCRLKADLE